MKKQKQPQKLNITFHDPNKGDEVAQVLTKIIVENLCKKIDKQIIEMANGEREEFDLLAK